QVHTPSLNERRDDLPLLIRHFIKKFSEEYKKEIRGLTQRAQILLGRYHWPGNVRELENVIGHGCMMTMADTIDVIDLPAVLTQNLNPGESAQTFNSVNKGSVTGQSLGDHEKKLVQEALQQAGGNQSQAARQLRIGRDALRYKMKKFGLL
ncbi:MAG TPA: helix-turn-helix domain-containing protein, partial [Candidatus Angelobacter sp.]|nr:helix-turn-helix domain-containing protein [Candidatus Angelobacter sp.]